MHRDQESRRLAKSEAAHAAHEDQRNRGEVHKFGLGCLLHSVAGRDVRNFVRHDSGELGFIVSRENEAGIHIKESTGKREGIDLIGFHDFYSEGDLRIRVANDVLSDAIDVFADRGVVEQFDLPLDFRSELPAHPDFLLE